MKITKSELKEMICEAVKQALKDSREKVCEAKDRYNVILWSNEDGCDLAKCLGVFKYTIDAESDESALMSAAIRLKKWLQKQGLSIPAGRTDTFEDAKTFIEDCNREDIADQGRAFILKIYKDSSNPVFEDDSFSMLDEVNLNSIPDYKTACEVCKNILWSDEEGDPDVTPELFREYAGNYYIPLSGDDSDLI